MLTDILSRTVSELSQLIVQFLDTLRFWAPSGGIRDDVRCLSWAHWKARSGLPISVNWTFFARCYGWGAIRAKIDRRSAFWERVGQYAPNFHVGGDVSHQSFFARIVRPMNALQLCRWQFHTKKLCSRLSSSEVRFWTENGRFAFLPPLPLGGLRGNVRWSLVSQLVIRNRVIDFLLVLNFFR